MRIALIRIVVIALLWFDGALAVQGQSKTDAVLRILAENAAGCGTLIQATGNRGYILTAAHVVENRETVSAIWHDGHQSPARVIVADRQLDVAILAVSPPANALTIPLAGSDHWPQRGDTVELIGYGGGRLRHWNATVNGYAMTDGIGRHQTLSLQTRTIGGDSGGAIVWRGKLVGVIWGGPLAGPNGPMLATHGTSCVAINAFLTTRNIDLTSPERTRIVRPSYPDCRGGSCPLPSRNPLPAPVNPDTQRLRESIANLEKRIAELEGHPNLNIDINDVSRRLIDVMAADPRFRGPPGRNGRDGSDGSSSPTDLDLLADRVKQRLAGSLRIRVAPVRH